jgi:hypothetical protein
MEKQEEIKKFFKDFLRENIKYLDKKKVDALDKKITAFHYKRAFSLGKAILTLSEYGPAIEIGILLRSLFNIRVNLHWMLADSSDERLKRYYDFRHIYRKKFSDHFNSKEYHPYEEEKKEIEKNFKEIKEKYNLDNPYKLYNWASKSIKKISNDVGASEEYDSLYGATSDLEHTNPNMEQFYLKLNEDNQIQEFGNQQAELIISFLLMAIHYLLVIKHLSAKIFHLDHEAVEEQISEFKKYQKENFSP